MKRKATIMATECHPFFRLGTLTNRLAVQGTAVDVEPDGRGAQPGDLLFFGKPGDKETGAMPEVPHVALSLGGPNYLHANSTTWSLAYNSLSPAASNYRADLHDSLIGVRRYRKS